jgi:hypothetical protein
VLVGEDHELDPFPAAELHSMRPRWVLGVASLRYSLAPILGVREPGDDEVHDLAFAPCQLIEPGRRA